AGVGLAGMLVRSDFGVLPAAMALVLMLAAAKEPALRRAAKMSLAELGGALIGLLVVVGHCWLVAGQPIQSSARQKLYWSALTGHSPAPAADVARRVIDPLAGESWWTVAWLAAWLSLLALGLRSAVRASPRA